jgi:hypothetical protein
LKRCHKCEGGGPPRRRRRGSTTTIVLLKLHGLHGTGIIRAYHARRVAPLMARALSLYEMMPNAPLDGTMLTHEMLHDTKVAQRIKDATMVDDLDFMFLISGHLTMRLDTGFFDLVSSFFGFLPPLTL